MLYESADLLMNIERLNSIPEAPSSAEEDILQEVSEMQDRILSEADNLMSAMKEFSLLLRGEHLEEGRILRGVIHSLIVEYFDYLDEIACPVCDLLEFHY